MADSQHAAIIDFDAYLSTEEAARNIPGNPSPQTVRSWMTTGYVVVVKGVPETIVLTSIRPGKKYFTTWNLILDFLKRKVEVEFRARTLAKGGADAP